MTKSQLLELFPIGNPFPKDRDRRRYDPVSAIVGGVGAIGSIIGGAKQSSAASKAAAIQAQAAKEAGQQVVDTAKAVNPWITSTAVDAGNRVTDTADAGAARVINQGNAAGADIENTASTAYSPYLSAGATAVNALQTSLPTGVNQMPTMAQLQIDPGFAFRMQQGTQAIQRSAAAQGGLLGAGTSKALTQYSQGLASQEYSAAFQRYLQSQQQNYSQLAGTASMGLGAGSNLVAASANARGLMNNASQFGAGLTTSGQEYAGNANINATDLTAANTMDAAKTQGNYMTQGANAEAAGKVGSANAWSSAFGGAGSSLMNGLMVGRLTAGGGYRSGMPVNYPQPATPSYYPDLGYIG